MRDKDDSLHEGRIERREGNIEDIEGIEDIEDDRSP